ncbi:T9SS type A sorting domain-containing protein, partial [Chryseobacterium sp. 2TAF14]|uniref:T9SS type A sorting domain-containing protein n=1 Tax=Chryseobacterium sp. 2TAF14 TaxID=3233007 RepID=UPI003F901053
NNGTYNYTVPGGLGNTVNNARIMVKGLNNIFFNVNLQNFTINSSDVVIPPTPTPGTPGAAPSPVYDGLMIYPVPSNDGIVYIKLDFPRLVPQAPYPFTYTIYAMDGKLVIPKKSRLFFSEHLEKIDLRGVPSGTYMIEVELQGEKIVKKLLMLNK